MESHLDKAQLQQFKQQLLQQRSDIQEELQQHKYNIVQMSSDLNLNSELAKVDNHFADQATEMYEQEKEIAIHDSRERALTRVNEALKRIQDDEYGLCTMCGIPIDIARLEAIPEASTCLEHAPTTDARYSSYEYQPIAMEQLSDDDRDSTAYDGEDSLQDVLKYGDSSYEEAITMLDTEFAQELVDELEGFCEPMESFLATDITGSQAYVVRNNAYLRYLANNEGDHELEEL